MPNYLAWLPSACLGLLVMSQLAAAEPTQIIFDTDIQTDVDDVGATAVLHALADRGECAILMMAVSAKTRWSAPCLDALNTYYGRGDIPIGELKGSGFAKEGRYVEKVSREFPHDLQPGEADDAVALYRRTLADAKDGSVVLVSVGFLTNLRNLLASEADDASPLGGRELVRRKIKVWVCMGGQFPAGREWNIRQDAAASVAAIRNWPTPIIFSGFEIGRAIQTGAGLSAAPKSSPVRRAYELYNGLNDRASWDQTAVLYAVRGLDGGLSHLWTLRRQGRIRVDDNGGNTWDEDAEDGPAQAYLQQKANPAEVAALIEKLMLAAPKK